MERPCAAPEIGYLIQNCGRNEKVYGKGNEMA